MVFRTYEFLRDIEIIKAFLDANKSLNPPNLGDIQFVLWEYELFLTDEKRVRLAKNNRDFHIVAGEITS